jgi:hypothetical protein
VKSNPAEPLCYSCKFRREIPGDAHSECANPLIGEVNYGVKEKLNISASPHGIRMGWFAWPYNFDPVWLENCDGYEARVLDKEKAS